MSQEGEREVNCSLCDAKFFSQTELLEHFRVYHRTDMQWIFNQ